MRFDCTLASRTREPDMWVASRLIGGFALAALGAASAQAQAQALRRVDLELVLAVDVSRSMDEDEHTLQRNGYVEAFRHKDVINALVSGPEGRIAVTYMEWAGDYQPRQIIGWTIIDSEKASRAFADDLAAIGIYGERRTSISTALYEAARLIEQNDIASHRQVIDVSGDGANNAGPPVVEARDAVLKKEIVINGLPILLNQGRDTNGFGGRGVDIDRLDRYYKQCVIGGAAAFIAPVYNLNQLSATIRKKLVLEIAGLQIETDTAPGTAPVQFAEAEPPAAPGIVRVQLKLPTEPADCFAGEKARAAREGGFGGFGNSPQR
jgi:hypothetical protein